MSTLKAHVSQLSLDIPFSEALQRFSAVNTKDLIEDSTNEQFKTAAPFVKWVGGKRSIINELTSRLPDKFNDYYEAFVGGGALFFELHEKLKNAYLSDINLDLLLTYQAVKLNPSELIAALGIHAKNNSADYYYEVRSQHDLKDPIAVAARFIYLNKTCFNGLYRVNSKGEFNVPVGNYKNPSIVTDENIYACSKALSRANIRLGGYNTISPKKGDFVYFDPPYHPTTESSFTAYSKDGFTETNQQQLCEFFTKLSKAGVKVMLSNSNTEFIRGLYKKFNIAIVEAPRYVNCKPNKRNSVEEVLITNYDYA